MPGKKPTPIAIRRVKGDTRKVGANKFAELCASAFEGTRGRPPVPIALKPGRKPKNPDELSVWKRTAQLMKIARSHWDYLADCLAADGLLSVMDEGMLTGASLMYAEMIFAARLGEYRGASEIYARYMQAADRMGLNESARSKIPKPGLAVDPVESAMLAG